VVEVTPELTPNPNALKFTLDRPSTDKRNETFRAGSDPAASPLGAAVFAVDGVMSVFMAADFVSVTKEPGADWDLVAPGVIEAIRAHFAG
jgi:scaffold Nfu/NifU family protein